MRFFGTTVQHYAFVDTDCGEFRVDKSNRITRWDDELLCYSWFDSLKYEESDIALILIQANGALNA